MPTIPSRLCGIKEKYFGLWIVDSRFTVLLVKDMSKSLMWEGIEPRPMPMYLTSQAFNDRLSTYTVSIHTPYSHIDSNVVLPHIRVHLYNPTGTLKFSASLRAKHVASSGHSPHSQHSRLTHLSPPTYSSSSSRPAFPGPPPSQRVQNAGAMLCGTSCVCISDSLTR
ncbi:hypothetical protein BGW80DRAFT_147649 [Lactifluus volemus]|nr:hypothetical protein BGW80DRAFT_147649 [Lactifluus volemus]